MFKQTCGWGYSGMVMLLLGFLKIRSFSVHECWKWTFFPFHILFSNIILLRSNDQSLSKNFSVEIWAIEIIRSLYRARSIYTNSTKPRKRPSIHIHASLSLLCLLYSTACHGTVLTGATRLLHRGGNQSEVPPARSRLPIRDEQLPLRGGLRKHSGGERGRKKII